MRFLRLVWISSLLLAGCAKDRSVEDYNREKFYTQLAELQSVEGNYSGLMTAQKDNSTFGALELRLRAEAKTAPDGQSSNTGVPILITEISFLGNNRINATAQSSFYQVETGQFQAEIPIPRTPQSGINPAQNAPGNAQPSPGATDIITVSATIRGGVMRGRLQARGYEGYGANFVLQLNGGSLESHLGNSKPAPDLSITQRNFYGRVFFENAVTKDVVMTLLRPEITGNDELHALLVPVKTVVMTWNFGNGARFSTSNAVWDQRSDRLRGQIRLTPDAQLNTDCRFSSQSGGFSCSQTQTTNSRVVNAEFRPMTATDPAEPPNSTAPSTPVTRRFKGQGQFDPSNPRDVRALEFAAVYGGRGPVQDLLELYLPVTQRILSVSFTFVQTRVSQSFTQATWDQTLGTITAVDRFMAGSRQVTLTLNCRNFYFTQQKSQFDCEYTNSATSEPATMSFTP